MNRIYEEIRHKITIDEQFTIPENYDINYSYGRRMPLLHFTCEYVKLNALKIILKHNPNIDLYFNGETCLYHVFISDSSLKNKMLKEILNYDFNTSIKIMEEEFKFYSYFNKYKELGETRFKIWVNML